MSTRIYGSSDDLIELEGDFREEFNVCPEDGEFGYLALSNGVVLRVAYDDDGIWRFTPLQAPGRGRVDRSPHGGETYSDVVTIDEPVTWALYGENFAGKGMK